MDKKIQKKMKTLFSAIMDEAEHNDEFANKICAIFNSELVETKSKEDSGEKRSANRRDKAVLDPVKMAGEGTLTREILEKLSEKELKDIIADYGMDSSKLAMKWKDRERLIQLIMDTAVRRASKGDAFRA